MTAIDTPPKPLRVLVLLLSVAAAVGGGAGLFVALFKASAVLWASAGFLVVLLIAAGIGLLAGFGRFASGYGMAALSVGGSIAGASLFAWRDLASNIGRDPQIGSVLLPWLGFEALCGVGILLAGASAVLTRRPRSWGGVGKGLAFLVPAGILVLAGSVGLDRIPSEDSGRVIALSVLLFGGIVVGTLVSIGGHHLIRAFELAADDPAKDRSS